MANLEKYQSFIVIKSIGIRLLSAKQTDINTVVNNIIGDVMGSRNRKNIERSSSDDPARIRYEWLATRECNTDTRMRVPKYHLRGASGNSVAIQCAWNLDPSVHWNATGENFLVVSVFHCASSVFQWPSSDIPVCFNYVNQHWIDTGTPLSACISQRGSSGIPVYLWLQWSSSVFQLCKLTLHHHWNTTVG